MLGGVWEVYGGCMGGVKATPPIPQTLCTSGFQPPHGRCCLFSPKCQSFRPNDYLITSKSHSYYKQMTILSRLNHVVIPAKCHCRLAPNAPINRTNQSQQSVRAIPTIGPSDPNNRSERSHQSVRAISMIAPSNRSPNPAFSLL